MLTHIKPTKSHSAAVAPLVARKKRANERRRLATRISRLVAALSMFASVLSLWVDVLLWPALIFLAFAIVSEAWRCWIEHVWKKAV